MGKRNRHSRQSAINPSHGTSAANPAPAPNNLSAAASQPTPQETAPEQAEQAPVMPLPSHLPPRQPVADAPQPEGEQPAAAAPQEPAPRGARPTDREPTGRRKRVPLGTPQPRLSAEQRPGFIRRFVNDTPGRITNALQGDYSHVIDETADEEDGRAAYRSEIVGVKEDGTALRAYLMEVPEDIYAEDQMIKQAPLDEFDQEMKRGSIRKADPRDGESYYVPDEGISVRSD